MADTTTLRCATGETLTVVSAFPLPGDTYNCSPADDSPLQGDVYEYCAVSTDPGCADLVDVFNKETLDAFWPWALLMFATAFGVRMLRKTIYAKA